MALSGTLSTTYKGYTYRIDWAATQNVGGNYSDVKLTHKLVCGSGWDLYIASHTGSATVGGVSANYTAPKISTGGGTTIPLGTTTHRIPHNADGSKANIAISGTFNFKATIQGTYKATLTASGTITLNTIPRASQPSCNTFPNHTENVGYFGDEIGIHMNRASDAFTHTVRYEFGTISEEIARNVTNGVTWTIPLGLMNLLPNTTKGSGRIYVDTYNGSTLIGTKYCGFTASIPASVRPSCETQVLDATTYKDTYGNLVKGLSKLKVNVTGTMAYSSPIVSSKTHVAYTPPSGAGVQMSYTGLSFTTGPLETAGTVKLRTTVTDSRGRTSDEFVVSFPIIDYTKPKVTALSVHRCDADGTENDQGGCISVDFSAEATPLNNKNTVTYAVRYKRTDMTSWSPFVYLEPDPAGDPYHLAMIVIQEADPDYSYDVEVQVQDDINTVTLSTSASTGYSLMDWGADGRSIAFGKVSEKTGTMEIAMDVEFLGELKGTIFDAIYPVGSVYIAYNHTNPSTLFGGTWERIENAFLWGVDSKGAIGTRGGEKTHTLTLDEIPAHNHGPTYSHAADGDKQYAWYTTAGDKIAYGSFNAGGGAAHNNMPPYVQVSIWRRTA